MLEIIRMSADRIPLHCLAISISRVGKARTNPLLRSGTPDQRDSVNVASRVLHSCSLILAPSLGCSYPTLCLRRDLSLFECASRTETAGGQRFLPCKSIDQNSMWRDRAELRRVQDLGNSFASFPVPEWGDSAALRFPGQYFLQLGLQDPSVSADQHVRPQAHGDRTFSIVAQRDTGNPQIRRFFLNAPGVGDHCQRSPLQCKEFDIGQRFQKMKPRHVDTELTNALARSWMHWKHNVQILTDLQQGFQNPSQALGIIDIRRPVQ